MKGLRFGAVAILDALGFKGIWRTVEPKSVLQKLRNLKQEGTRLSGRDHNGILLNDETFDHRVVCISDTIVIAVTVRGSAAVGYPERPIYRTMLSASLIATHLIHHAIKGTPSLLFRGCLSAGLLNIDGDFIIGPAIDEAAELHENADGPFFYMAPSSLRIDERYADTFNDRIEPNLMIRYALPMKRAGQLETLVHPYFGLTQSPENWANTRGRLIRAFGEGMLPPDVERKRSNTVAFLDYVEKAAVMQPSRKPFRMPQLDDLTFDQKIHLLIRGGVDALRSFPRASLSEHPPSQKSRHLAAPKGATSKVQAVLFPES